jgi:formate hydrogenlyase subunit 6/NADH:ubiquinone oxidoreductase subunit I
MAIKKLTKDAFNELVDSLISEQKVIGVQSKADKFDFELLQSAKDLRLDYDVTLQPPKKYFIPPVETLLTFEVGGEYKSEYDAEKFILIGIHPYDMVAINQLDSLFSQDNVDTHYMTRRNSATVIACDVVTPSENIFASSMGTAIVNKGYDIILTDIGDCYVAEAATEKGQSLLAKASQAVDAGDEDLKKRQEVRDRNEQGLNKHKLNCKPLDLPKLLDKTYDHPVWEEKAKTCFSCGSCNQVCPTCYCFNVQDDVDWNLQTGKRQRSWDGCLLDGFTKVAGDHEFRGNRADRFRHRLYRKGKYVPGKIGGQIACVGCGRCINACLPDIANPVSIYNRLVEDIGVD